MDSHANCYIRKLLGLPRCFSDVGLFGRNMLELPIKSISLGYKQEKACLELELSRPTYKECESSHPHRQQMEGSS